MDEVYGERIPTDRLRRSLHCLWFYAGDPGLDPQRIAPDGRCELILHLGSPYEALQPDGGWSRQGEALFVGQLTRPLTLRAPGRIDLVAARFRPAAARAFTRRPLERFTNRAAPLSELVAPHEITALVAELRGAERGARPGLLEKWLAPRLADGGDDAVERCVEAIYDSEGRIGMAALQHLSGLPARTLQRRFAVEVGAPPRLLASVVRFRRVFEALEAPQVRNWTDAAQAAGYFDHPQMTRDFRRFLGCTPSAFLASRRGLAANLVDLAHS